MTWTKIFCGRFETRFIYSKGINCNNFPFCTPSERQRKKIEQTAQNILDARKKYPDATLADLYDENLSESEFVAELMKLYKDFTDK